MLTPSWGSLRTLWRVVSNSFFPNRPTFDKTVCDYNLARALYQNTDESYNLGAGFARPIIDLVVEFMDLPSASSDDDNRDNFLNECIHDYWAPKLQEVVRNACRDSKTIVRLRQPLLRNRLVTSAERDHCFLEVYDPESVHIIYAPDDADMIEQVIVTHFIEFDETDPLLDPANNPNLGSVPTVKEHEIIEIISPDSFRYFDKTDNKWLTSWETSNPWGFVPVMEVWNEYDTTLSGGQSDLESVLPFLKAFHEVLLQGLNAHSYHSTPKLKFKVRDVGQFLANNFPDTIDPVTRRPKSSSTINWKGREILFFTTEEDAEFIEAESVLSDTKVLLEFLIDCISIASDTPEWAFMRVESATSQGAMNAQTLPFEKRIGRKRIGFNTMFQSLCKMVLVINGKSPARPTMIWPLVRVDDLVTKGQAIQQMILGFDVASQHQWMSDSAIQKELAQLFKTMKSPELESAEAKTNFVPLAPAPAPQSDSQALPPKGTSTNGAGSKSAGKRALTSTKAAAS
jgi:hypothetical protein